MKRSLWILASFALACGGIVQESSRGQFPASKPGDIGPGEQGSKLRMPGMETPVTPAPATSPALPTSIQNLYNPTAAPTPIVRQPTANRIAQLPSNKTDINKEFEITPEVGPWVVFVMAYSGEKAPVLAHNFVRELREGYQIKGAYVFNYGAEEKLKEYQRVQKLKQQQIDELAQAGLKGEFVPIPIRAARIDEQTGVLIGGFCDRDDALRALEKIKKLKAPDPKKVAMDVTYLGELERDKEGRVLSDAKMKGYVKEGYAYVNPFTRAFPARNPSVKNDVDVKQMTSEEMEALRKINADVDFSLFTCKGKLTLVVKQFDTQFKMAKDANESRGFLDRFFNTQKGDGKDNAFHNAHNLAEGLRKTGLPETYVLHTKFCSFVTVGGFEKLDDPRLVAMQNHLEARFRSADPRLKMFPRPVPMMVPH